MKLITYIKFRMFIFKNVFLAKKASAGFTLVEAMVAISILSVSITAPLFIAQKGISSAIYSRDQITAFYLAQEGVEYIRNVRDTNRVLGNPWLDQLGECIGQDCTVDASYSSPSDVNAIKSCTGSCIPLTFDTSSGIYGYGVGLASTKFTRTIRMENAPGSDEALIAVTIAWNTNLFTPTRTFTVREYIFNY